MTQHMDNDTAAPLSRKLRTADIEENVPLKIEATRAEMADIVRLLDLVSLDGLTLDYRLRREAAGRMHLSGRLVAAVTQTCVVSLEPVEQAIDLPVEIEFWPQAFIAELENKAEDPGHAGLLDWPEAIVDGMIDLGPVVYESLATALDPYPKREGAKLQWAPEAEEAGRSESGPFAALKQLKGQ